MNLFASIANSLWAASSYPGWAKFRWGLHQPAETQEQLLRGYLSTGARTVYGQAHGFAEIKTYEEFARRVPLVGYDELEPWINRIAQGGQRVLTDERVTHLIPTSGSSGARKLIPFTATLQHEFNRAIGPWMSDLYSRYPAIALGPAYWSITPATPTPDDHSSRVPVGFTDDSAYLGGTQKKLVAAIMAVPSELRLITDLEVFRYVTLLCLLRQSRLRLISVWHPSFLSLLLDALPELWESLLNDLRTGRCRYPLPEKVLGTMRLRPCPARARQLEKAGPEMPATVWPGLRVISCWDDGHARFARADLARRFPGIDIQAKGLLATEAVVTIPFAEAQPLAVCSHFFEFMNEQGRICRAHEVKAGETYEVIVTTGGGLWRYRLQDQVEVTGLVERTPALRFLGRTGNVSDRFGEKLSEAFVARVLREAMDGLKSLPRFALLAPDEGLAGWHYTLYLEGEVTPELGSRLEAGLRQNPQYAWCRDLGQLQPPGLFRIRANGYETFATREVSQGKRLGEIKPCALSLRDDWSRHFEGHYFASASSRSSNVGCE